MFKVVVCDDYVATEEEKHHVAEIESRPGYAEWHARKLAETKKKFGL